MVNEKRLIDADALLLSIRTTLLRSKYIYAKNPIISDVLDGFDELVMGKVKNAPTVDAVEVVHGRWEEAGFDGHGDYKECCSNCKAWSIGDDKLYCPVCGAKMDGDGNG